MQREIAPFFSIIIPIYNVEKYLSRCLDSVLNQSFKNIEIILINDGSTDTSGEIAREYAKSDHRIKLINQENKGQGHARNIGLKMGGGDYILFVDSDDYIEKDMCEKLYEVLKHQEIEVLVTPFFFVKGKRKILGDYFTKILPQQKIFDAKTGADSILRICKNSLFITTIAHFIFKNDYLKQKNIYFPEGILYEDVIFCTDAFLQAKKIYLSKICKYYYDLTPISTMRGKASFSKKVYSANSYYVLANLLQQRIQNYTESSLKEILKISSETAMDHTLRAIQKTNYHKDLIFTKDDLLGFNCNLSILQKLNLHYPIYYRLFFPLVLFIRRVRIVLSRTIRSLYAIFFNHNSNL
ncbi:MULTISPECIES: glycosyltransferase [unclassified Helicobacter]|uniref:glycosyltransferase n=1 Tax=unclassified Helicobacter TaxID=2593540 RepID=UPI000CF15B55|nr:MULTISPECIES: glycosyltransferase [unclassified Helicobacter]